MMRLLSFLSLFFATLLSGCAYHLPVYGRSADVRLQVQCLHPEDCTVRVTEAEPPSDYPISPDGRVVFTVPRFRRGCSIYVFDVIKIADATPERIRVVEVRRKSRILRKLSLAQIGKLPADAYGYQVVKVAE